MGGFVAFALGFAVLQAVTYVVNERRHRDAWVRDVAYVEAEAAPGASFRGTDGAHTYIGPELRPRAPLHTRAIALWSIGMGQMLIPGGLVAAGGAFIYGLGLVGIPGCFLAARIWALGPALLRAEPDVVHRARDAARTAFVLNAIVLAVAVLLGLDRELWGIGIFTGGYALVSIAHGIALQRAANTIEALWVERGYDPQQLRTLRLPPRPPQREREHAGGFGGLAPAAPNRHARPRSGGRESGQRRSPRI